MTGPVAPGRPLPVPSGRLRRLAGLGGVTGGIAGRVLLDGARTLGRGRRPVLGDLLLTPGNVARLSDELARMRGAAMKLGQLISMDAGEFLPPELAQIMARLRASADFMPPRQLRDVLDRAWGDGWRRRFAQFDVRPMAAASIGQVHRARTHYGRDLAIKVQYPGVAESIDSDIDNVVALFRLSGLAPRGLDLAPLVAEARRQLREEADYVREAAHLRGFAALVDGTKGLAVPGVAGELTGPTVLAMEFLRGRPIDAAADLPQEVRDDVVARLLDLSFREVFEFGRMQTDPNFANFLYDAEADRIGLLDFGATRDVSPQTAGRYRRLLRAGLDADRDGVRDASIALGFFDAQARPQHQDLVLRMIGLVFDAIGRSPVFDFARTDLVAEISESGMMLAADRDFAHIPPMDVLYAQRKVAGMYLIARRLRARVALREMLERWAKPAAAPRPEAAGA
jgi:predicted unusual protein kinase regulating ubiquinone biosynthesis (AarF/ABC1/UbiB family)